MSDYPRTDAMRITRNAGNPTIDDPVPASFAERLEAENAKLRGDNQSLHRKYNIAFAALTKLVRSPADAPEIAPQAVQECIDVE